ncbi:MAG: ATP-binding protein [Candidatus Heimdallarchaeaceae archaeon]
MKFFHIPPEFRGGSTSMLSEYKDISFNTKKFEQKILLGHKVENGTLKEAVSIDLSDILLNVEIYGMIGQGKTSLVRSIIDQLLKQHIGCLIIDIKGEYSTSFANYPEVEIYTIGKPHPLCINLFHNKDENDIRSTLLLIEEMMISSNQEFTPAMKNLFESSLFLTYKSQVPNLTTFVENLFRLANRVQNKTNNSYIQQTLDAVLNRLNYIFNPINFEILGVKYSTLDFTILDKGKSIILDLSEFQKRAARPSDIFLIVNLVLKMLYQHASLNGATRKLRYVAILEEAVNIIPNIYTSESSASLITSENNFLLGRSLGIGHITISQLWNSVSNIVHGNSATKIIFRSSEKIEKIASAINIAEASVKRIRTLPIRHCLVFMRGNEGAFEIRTQDSFLTSLGYSEYRSLLNQKYKTQEYPLLYDNFIDMRASIYEQYYSELKKEKSTPDLSNENKITDDDSSFRFFPKEIFLKDKTNFEEQSASLEEAMQTVNDDFYRKDVCEIFCSNFDKKRSCLEKKYSSKLVCNIIFKRYAPEQVVDMFDLDIEKIILKIAKSKKIKCDKFLILCTKIEILTVLARNGFLSFSKIHQEILKKLHLSLKESLTLEKI